MIWIDSLWKNGLKMSFCIFQLNGMHVAQKANRCNSLIMVACVFLCEIFPSVSSVFALIEIDHRYLSKGLYKYILPGVHIHFEGTV